MAPVVRELRQTPGIESFVCVTAQHREMLDQVLHLFGIRPDFDLNLMRDDQSLAELSSRIFSDLDPVLADVKPDWILVQGDTTTVAIASLLAYYRRIRVGHVEAGLRTHNKWQPFPEEINRRVAGVAADLHFAPTEEARQNLLREGVPDAAIVVTGNPVIDALYAVAGQPEPVEITQLVHRLGIGGKVGSSNDSPAPKRLILVTAHRRENFGLPLENICSSLKELASRGDVEIVYSVHLNPNVQEPANRILGNVSGVTLTEPLEYLPLVHLMKRSTLVLTDSGGIQEEAPGLGKPVLVLREVTERPEAVQAGTVRLVGTDRTRIVEWTRRLLNDRAEYEKMARAVNPYGDGKACARISDIWDTRLTIS